MKRSHWPSLALFALVLLIITTSLLVNILHVRADSATRGKLFVLMQGINTTLQSNNPPTDSFGTRNGIVPYLSSVYPGSQFLMYSYNGDNGNGYPLAYQCQDTFAGDAKADVLKLAKQVGDYLKDKTNLDVYVIAHSFGGLVAYGYLSYLLSQNMANANIPGTTGDRLAGVVTLDAPLGGIPNDLYVARIFMIYSNTRQCPPLLGHPLPSIDQLFALYNTGASVPHGANNSIAKVLFNTSVTNEAIASAAAAQGIQILTIGNTRDYLYNPSNCDVFFGRPLIGTNNYLNTQWLSDQGNSSGIYGRYFIDGIPTCDNLSVIGINHAYVFDERSIQAALGQLVNKESLTALPVATGL